MYKYSFEKLEVWQRSKELVLKVYQVTKNFPPEERFGLCSQIQRAAVSVPSNIAEGSTRASLKEQIHFVEIAYGSLMEIYCQLNIAQELNYITSQTFDEMAQDMKVLSAMLNAYGKS